MNASPSVLGTEFLTAVMTEEFGEGRFCVRPTNGGAVVMLCDGNPSFDDNNRQVMRVSEAGSGSEAFLTFDGHEMPVDRFTGMAEQITRLERVSCLNTGSRMLFVQQPDATTMRTIIEGWHAAIA